MNFLDIREKKFTINSANHILDPIDKILFKCKDHPSILKIKEKVLVENKFTFLNVTKEDLVN